jgi:proton-translocating NADH-quinone oxidoreductase chain N
MLMMYQSLGTVGLIFIVAVVALLAGIGFKLGLPPFHQWVPDVYEGAPTPIAAFLSVGSKGAGLIAFAKIFLAGLSGFWGITMVPYDWGYLTGIIAAAALIYGNVVAIRQTNIKRMLGYSSIAQAGYIMIGMVAINMHGLSAVGYYLFAYLFANMGAFAIVAAVEDRIGSTEITSYRGLSTSAPGLSITLSVFLLSLAGIPPLAGFMAKYKVFAAAVSAAGADPANHWLYWLVGVGLITAVFSLYYYANVIKQMYFWPEPSEHKIKLTAPGAVVIGIGLAGVIIFGIYAQPVLDFADQFASVYGLLPR